MIGRIVVKGAREMKRILVTDLTIFLTSKPYGLDNDDKYLPFSREICRHKKNNK